MKIVTLISLLLIVCASGCMNLKPIKTELIFESPDGRTARYVSEKDVIGKLQIDPESGAIVGVEFSVLASAPAYAQVERDIVQARNNAAQMAAFERLISTLAQLALSSVNPMSSTGVAANPQLRPPLLLTPPVQ